MINNGKEFNIDLLVSEIQKLAPTLGVGSFLPIEVMVDELRTTLGKLDQDILTKLKAIQAGDPEKLLEVVTELREAVDHLLEHCQEASGTLWRLTEVVGQSVDGQNRLK